MLDSVLFFSWFYALFCCRENWVEGTNVDGHVGPYTSSEGIDGGRDKEGGGIYPCGDLRGSP